MNWLWLRIAAVLAALALGAVVGEIVGGLLHLRMLTAIVGGAFGIALLVLFDGLRARRLLHWLRQAQQGEAPHDPGFWGEMGYRMERAVRLRDRSINDERQRLEQFLSAIEASPNGVMLLDGNDQIGWCNRVAADHFGLDPERDRQQRVTNLVRAPVFVAYLQQGRFEEPVKFAAAGGTLSVLVRRYGDGMKLVLTQDVTERERTEAMRRDFVANISHEIRTPLTVLAGFIETMDNLPLTEVERRRVLLLMGQQTDRMQALVADLLILAQLEGSPRPAAHRWVPVRELMNRARTDALALSASRHALEFSGGADAELAGSDGELQSALGNLVNNAVRYTPEGGHIEVQWLWRADGGGELLVCDSGLGIAREHLPRLTERFYRVDGSRSRDTGGTGLGLAIVKHVVQRHGGEIDIQSEIGKGSRFKLVFPASRVRRVAVLAPQPATVANERHADGAA